MSKVIEFLKETKTELKHVNWPTRSQTFFYTLVTVFLSIFVAYFLGFFDYLFSLGLGQVLNF